jgi:predicted phage terminase large subunit-like protein
MNGNTIYITDYVDGYIDAADLPNWIEKNVNRAGYDNKKSLITIEPKGSGKVVVSLLKKLTNLNVVEYQYPRAAKVNINIKKEERAEAIVPMVESNRVILVEGDWNEKFISQVTTFPLAKSDEAVDCLVMAVLRAHYVDSRYKKYAVKRTN